MVPESQNSSAAPYRQPAEWTPHQACWLAWPAHPDLWQDDLAGARDAFVALCRAILDPEPTGAPRGERLEILTLDPPAAADAARALRDLPARFHAIPYGDIWLRDTAPVFTVGADLAATCFGFNGWGEKYLFPPDLEVAERVAAAAGLPRRRFPWVFEGGAIDVDGEGSALATRQCLLNPNRGPAVDPTTVERRLLEALGIERVIWLERGLAHDHTDGHVDMVARFVAPGVVTCMATERAGDPSRDALAGAVAALEQARDARGRRLEVIPLPSPGPGTSRDGEPLAQSYANFYIANTTVVVPTYALADDDRALDTLTGLFPDRRIVAVDARAIITGGGGFHCITQQQPRNPAP